MQLKKVSIVLYACVETSTNDNTIVWGPGTRSRLYNSTGFLLLCWAAHYFPFWSMARQRFLHHYLPAHLASVLVAGALIEFIFNIDPIHFIIPKQKQPTEDKDDPSGKSKATATKYRFITSRERMGTQSIIAIWLVSIGMLVATAWSFWFFAPFTFGFPGLDVPSVNARRWLNYDFHFSK